MTSEDRAPIELACARLINHYANLSDAQDWEAVAALYMPDGRFARPSGDGSFVEGRQAILDSFRARPARAQRHIIANTVVTVEGPAAAWAFSAILLFQGEPAAAGVLPAMSANSPLVGWYRDAIVRTADGWRFQERVGGLDFGPRAAQPKR